MSYCTHHYVMCNNIHVFVHKNDKTHFHLYILIYYYNRKTYVAVWRFRHSDSSIHHKN